jgi:hypothetical protein
MELELGDMISVATKAIKNDGSTLFVKGEVVAVSADVVDIISKSGKTVSIRQDFIGSVVFDDAGIDN